jgi:adenine phosphoribosyltransferase
MDAPTLAKKIRAIPDFPKPGILFRDVTPLLLDPVAFRAAAEAMAAPFQSLGVERVLGIESRGFLFAAPIALALGVGLGLVRKQGKLPSDTLQARYELEYGVDTVEMHVDAVGRGQRVLIVDDLIATGGTAAATARLVEQLEARVEALLFVIELKGLGGRQKLVSYAVEALLEYEMAEES